MSPPSLFFRSLNTARPSTILLLHGLWSSHHEYDLAIPFLNDYHLLIPDLPSHGRSSGIEPFSLPKVTSELSNLIIEEAKDGRAHVAGLSLGGYSALHLAHHFPELVRSLFVTGCGNMFHKRPVFAAAAPYVAYTFTKPLLLFPSAFEWLLRISGMESPPGLVDDMRASASFKLASEGYSSLARDGKPNPLPHRTLALAGAKQDPIEETSELGRILSLGNPASRAVKVKNMYHAWDIQAPQLFADGLKAWIEDETLPAEYEFI